MMVCFVREAKDSVPETCEIFREHQVPNVISNGSIRISFVVSESR